MPTKTAPRVTVGDGTVADVLGCFKVVEVSFNAARVLLDFLGVCNMPFDVIIGSPNLKALHARLDFK